VSAWETYRPYVMLGAGLMLVEMALIALLLLQRRGRRQALRAVERSHAELVQRIAERERAEQELRENHQQLARVQDVDRRKDEFLATLGHELRNPLAPISIAVAIMRERPDDSTSVIWAREMIGRQVTVLSRLVDDLLDVSRITLGKIELWQEALIWRPSPSKPWRRAGRSSPNRSTRCASPCRPSLSWCAATPSV